MTTAPESDSSSAPYNSLRDLIGHALKLRASDIHLKTGRPPALRVDGVLQFTKWPVLTESQVLLFLKEMLKPDEIHRYLETGDLDHAVTLEGLGRFRINCYKERGHVALVMRHVKGKIPTFAELNLPEAPMNKIASLARGLVLITGTTSSGKSTTLAALIDRLNETRHGHIVTLEDPIEFLHADKLCSISQREVGIDTADFETGLRAVMREDPNIILIGEMRDSETFHTCISAAETGHLVFSTLHTSNVMMTVDRILDMFPADQHDQVRSQLALQLTAVVSQRLLPAKSGKGRVPAVEIMFNNPGIAELIRTNEIDRLPLAINDGEAEGMMSFNLSLTHLVKDGLVSEEAAMWAADNPEELKMNLQGIFISRGHGGILKKPKRS